MDTETAGGREDEANNGDSPSKSNTEKFKKGLMSAGVTIPPSGFFGRLLTRGLIVVLIWAVLWSIIGADA